eukprot:scaffold50131_cov27-Tisochrysis_lutea.AAC.1
MAQSTAHLQYAVLAPQFVVAAPLYVHPLHGSAPSPGVDWRRPALTGRRPSELGSALGAPLHTPNSRSQHSSRSNRRKLSAAARPVVEAVGGTALRGGKPSDGRHIAE